MTARRLFISRRAQEWPPVIVAHESWDTLYAEAAVDLGVLPDVGEAVVWTNELIARIP